MKIMFVLNLIISMLLVYLYLLTNNFRLVLALVPLVALQGWAIKVINER